MEGELIYVSIITSLFGIMGLLILNRNWFKKMKWKEEAAFERASNKLKLKKLERELLGTAPQSPKEPLQQTPQNILGSLAPILKNLEPDQIAGLIEAFTGQAGAEAEAEMPEDNSLAGIIGKFAAENPELIKGAIEGFKSKMAENAPVNTTGY